MRPGLAVEIAGVWLETPFSEEARHKRRLAKIAQAEAGPARRPGGD